MCVCFIQQIIPLTHTRKDYGVQGLRGKKQEPYSLTPHWEKVMKANYSRDSEAGTQQGGGPWAVK